MTKIKLPNSIRWNGKDISTAEALERVLKEESKTPTPNTSKIPDVPFKIANPQDYIFLNGRTHGSYSYPNLLVCKYRLADCHEVQNAAKQLVGINIANSAKESNGRDYIGNINWNQALSLNLMLGGRTLIPREFEDLLLLLKSGRVIDGTGKTLPRTELEEILNEIMQVKSPWRAEWLDADFKYLDAKGNPVSSDKSGELFINYLHELKNGFLAPKYHEKLEPCLMKDAKAKLVTMNGQGMAVQEGDDFYFWYPRKDNNSVARFDADSDRAHLDCYGLPDDSDSSLGVRLVVRPKGDLLKNLNGGQT